MSEAWKVDRPKRQAEFADAELIAELQARELEARREIAKMQVKMKAAEEREEATEKRCKAERDAALDAERRKTNHTINQLQSERDDAVRSVDALTVALEEERLSNRRARDEALQCRTQAQVMQRKLLHAQSQLYGAHLQLETFASKAPPRVLREVSRVSELGGHALHASPSAFAAHPPATPLPPGGLLDSMTSAHPPPLTARTGEALAAASGAWPAASPPLEYGDAPAREAEFAGRTHPPRMAPANSGYGVVGASGGGRAGGGMSGDGLWGGGGGGGRGAGGRGEALGKDHRFEEYVASLRQRTRSMVEMSADATSSRVYTPSMYTPSIYTPALSHVTRDTNSTIGGGHSQAYTDGRTPWRTPETAGVKRLVGVPDVDALILSAGGALELS